MYKIQFYFFSDIGQLELLNRLSRHVLSAPQTI